MAKCKYTDEQAMEWAKDYYYNCMSQMAISEKYGVPQKTVCDYLRRPRIALKFKAELDSRASRAELRAKAATTKLLEFAPKMVDQIVEIGSQSVANTPIQYQYAIFNAAVDMLNRAGVKAKEQENNEVHVVFENGVVELGTPDGKEGEA